LVGWTREGRRGITKEGVGVPYRKKNELRLLQARRRGGCPTLGQGRLGTEGGGKRDCSEIGMVGERGGNFALKG